MPNSVKDESIIKSIQTTLTNLSLYGGRIDGLFGKVSRERLIIMVKKVYPSSNLTNLPANGFDAKSVFIFIQTVLARVGLYTITIDGIWGPTSQRSFDSLATRYRKLTGQPEWESSLPLSPATVTPSFITEAQLKAMLPQSNWDKVELYLGPLNETMEVFEINTGLRKAHFMAQVLHETAYFKYSEEIASGKAYEGRADLGNTQPGDGMLFKGRGMLQITGRTNYVKCQAYLRERLNSPTLDITSSTTAASQLATNPLLAALASGYFWSVIKPKLNASADADDIYWVSVYVNGWAKQANPYYPNKEKEPNHMKERVAMLNVTKKAFGLV